MHRIVIFGNSGSGKTTLAKQKARSLQCAHLDLDTIAWQGGQHPPTRMPLSDSNRAIDDFLKTNTSWVIEGCYADLLELVISRSTELVFLNPGVSTCIKNCENRPWESHKYASPEAQNANLAMLIGWIRQYEIRSDEFSLLAHRALYDAWTGAKQEYTSNKRPKPASAQNGKHVRSDNI